MNFADFVDALKLRLQQPLPGEEAQRKMVPALRKTSRHYLENNPDHKKGSVLVLLYVKENEIATVLILRQPYKGVHSAQVSFPGGKTEPGENATAAALREAEEELGLDTKSIEILGELTWLYIPASNFLVHPVIGICREEVHFSPQEREVQQVIEFPLGHLLKPSAKAEKIQETSYAGALRVPYYDIRGHHVWGATAMILSELETLVAPFLST